MSSAGTWLKEILHHLGYIIPLNTWDKLPTSTGAGFLPSTVSIYILIYQADFQEEFNSFSTD